jgi:hypothetical protein
LNEHKPMDSKEFILKFDCTFIGQKAVSKFQCFYDTSYLTVLVVNLSFKSYDNFYFTEILAIG